MTTPTPAMETLRPDGWPRGHGYANGMAATGRAIFVSGQIGWNPVTTRIETDDFVEQVALALRNIVAVLHAGGAAPEHLTRLTWFITNKTAYMDARHEIGRVYRDVIGRHFPTMSVVVVSALIEDRAQVEIEATAVIPEGAAS